MIWDHQTTDLLGDISVLNIDMIVIACMHLSGILCSDLTCMSYDQVI